MTILCVLTLFSCMSSHPSDYSFFAMDTYMSLKLCGKGNAVIANAIQGDAEFFSPLLSVTDESGDIYRLNHAEGEAITVDNNIPPMIEEAKALCEELDGCLDISLYPVSSAWGFTTDSYRIPTQEEIDELLKTTGYRNITIDSGQSTVTLPKGMMIDLGAIAKGWLADRAKGILENRDDISGIADFGGTILPWGLKDNKELWTVGIRDPADPSSYFGTLLLTERVISTSGGYERYFTGEDGNKYIHIIDPQTGYPVDNGTLSVTVVCDSGIAADAMSTALFVMGAKKATEYYRSDSRYSFDFAILDDQNNLYITEGIADSFTLSDGRDYSVVRITK